MTRNIIDAKISFQFDNLKINLIMLNHSIVEWNYPKHSHGKNFYEVHYIDGGKGKLICEDKEYPLESGVLVMTGPFVPHEQQTDSSNPMSEYCFEFEIQEDNRRKSTTESELLKDTIFWIGNDTQNLGKKFQNLDAENKQHGIGYIHIVKSVLTEILVALIRNYNGDAERQNYLKITTDDKRMLIADEIFLFEYANVTLDSLSSRLGLSRRQTQRFLQKAYGKSFIEIRTKIRREKAEELMRNGMSVREAAAKVGYETSRSLSILKF